MPRKRDDIGKCMNAALSLAALQGWQSVTLLDIATEAGMDIADVSAAIRSPSDTIRELIRRADQEMLAAIDEDWAEEKVRDRLFTLIMARLDYLKPHRQALRALLVAAPSDPMGSIQLALGSGLPSMRVLLEASGIATGGIKGRMRVRAMAIAYGLVVRVFLDDDTEDLSKTMAALDRRLAGLERLATWSRPRRSGKPVPEDDAIVDTAP